MASEEQLQAAYDQGFKAANEEYSEIFREEEKVTKQPKMKSASKRIKEEKRMRAFLERKKSEEQEQSGKLEELEQEDGSTEDGKEPLLPAIQTYKCTTDPSCKRLHPVCNHELMDYLITLWRMLDNTMFKCNQLEQRLQEIQGNNLCHITQQVDWHDKKLEWIQETTELIYDELIPLSSEEEEIKKDNSEDASDDAEKDLVPWPVSPKKKKKKKNKKKGKQ